MTLDRVIPRLVPLILSVLLVSGCAAPPAGTPDPSPAPTVALASPTPTSVPTAAPTASSTPIPLPSFTQISAPSGSVVWALVAATRLFRSTDRGDTWQERPLPQQRLNSLVSFIDDHEGWVAMSGSPGAQCQSQSVAISHTFDADATWEPVSVSGIAAAQCKGTVMFADATRGFLTAYGPDSAPVIYRSADGGRSWIASRPFADPPGSTSSPGGALLTPGPVRSFGATLLVAAAGSNSGQYAYRSSDAGATWSYVSTAPISNATTIAFVTAVRWLQIGAPGESKETTDGGATWHAFTTDYRQAAPVGPTVVFGDAQVGYATVRGAIQRTTDGGAHWISIRTPGTF